MQRIGKILGFRLCKHGLYHTVGIAYNNPCVRCVCNVNSAVRRYKYALRLIKLGKVFCTVFGYVKFINYLFRLEIRIVYNYTVVPGIQHIKLITAGVHIHRAFKCGGFFDAEAERCLITRGHFNRILPRIVGIRVIGAFSGSGKAGKRKHGGKRDCCCSFKNTVSHSRYSFMPDCAIVSITLLCVRMKTKIGGIIIITAAAEAVPTSEIPDEVT